jgi:Family of unknown function (DUF6951)
MQARTVIDPGTCGFTAAVTATVEGGREARFTVESQCEHVAALVAALAEREPFDVYAEMDPRTESPLHAICRESLKGSYPWCPVPLGLLKAMQVAAGLSLPDSMSLTVTAAEKTDEKT